MGDAGDEIAVTESRKLFIGSLSRDTTDDGLKHYFSRFGEVEEATVMRDKFTRESRGFGFVTFRSAEDAKVVLEQPSDLQLDKKILKPELAQPRGAARRGGPGGFDAGGRGGGGPGGRFGGGRDEMDKLYVGMLSSDTDDDSFRRHFEQYGTVRDCIVMRDRNTNRSRGFGFVTFDSDDGVEKCLADAQEEGQQVLDGRPITVKLAVPKDIMRIVDEEKHRARMDGLDEAQAKKLFVKGIEDSVNEGGFVGFFKRYGNVSEAFLVKDRGTGRHRGFGFITFENFDSVVHVLNSARPLVLNGRRLICTRAQPKEGERGAPPPRDGYGARGSPRRGGGGYGGPPPARGPPARGGYDDYDRAPPARGPPPSRGGYEERRYDRGYDRGSGGGGHHRDAYHHAAAAAPAPRERAPRDSYGAPPPAHRDSYGARDSYAPPPERDSYRERAPVAESYGRGGGHRGSARDSYASSAPAPRDSYGHASSSGGGHGAAYGGASSYESRGGGAGGYDSYAHESRGAPTSYASPASGTTRSYKAYYDDPRAAEAPPRAHVRDSGYSTGGASSYDSRGGHGGGGGYSSAPNGSRGGGGGGYSSAPVSNGSRGGGGYGRESRGGGGGGARYRPY